MRSGVFFLAALLFLTGVSVGVVLTGRLRTQTESEAALPLNNQTTVTSTEHLEFATQRPAVQPATEFTDVAERTIPAVANISSRQVVRQRSVFGDDPFFRYFFGDAPNFSGYRERPSLGSGVIVDSTGYILTNAHVVGSRTAGITVTLADNREYEAELVGRDESTDIALLRVAADSLPTIPWGDSTALRIAEWVMAVGNPFQLNQTVTLGIVSAVGRDNLGVARYEDFIQTDAAINPGNSGGALINARGELVGINTAIFSESGGYQGVGFAVPSNLARRVMDDLIKFGEVHRGSIGYVDVRALTPALASQLEAPNTNGVVVWRIHQASSAAQAGIEPGDIIISFDGQPIEDPSDYTRQLSDAEIGSTAILEIFRMGQLVEFKVLVSQARQ